MRPLLSALTRVVLALKSHALEGCATADEALILTSLVIVSKPYPWQCTKLTLLPGLLKSTAVAGGSNPSQRVGLPSLNTGCVGPHPCSSLNLCFTGLVNQFWFWLLGA